MRTWPHCCISAAGFFFVFLPVKNNFLLDSCVLHDRLARVRHFTFNYLSRMKKIVLLLLASLGMTLGFTLSSCSNGGSSESSYEPSRAFPGTTFSVVNITPGFSIEFTSANTAWVNTIRFTPGVGRGYQGFFSINQARPPKMENGIWTIWGDIGFTDGTITSDSDMRKLLGVNAGAYEMTINRFVLLLEIPAGKQSGAYAGTGNLFAEGEYWMNSSVTEPTEFEREVSISYEAIGVLKEEYLVRPGEKEENDQPFEY